MKTIFIATDFSSYSYDAVKYGIQLAHKLSAKTILFHVYHTAVSIPEAFSVITSDELKHTAESEMQKLADSLKCNPDQMIDVLAVEGDVEDMIILYSEKYKDSLILCGIKGTDKRVQFMFGNTASSLIRRATHPLLVIPENCIFQPINNMVFATDILLQTNISTLDPLKWIGECFSSKAYIVRVMSSDLNVIEELNYRSERITEHLKKLHPEYVFLKSDDVTSSLLDFVKDKSIDLLSLMPRNHTFLERVFNKSESKSVLFNAKTPMLFLPEMVIRKAGKQREKKSEYHA